MKKRCSQHWQKQQKTHLAGVIFYPKSSLPSSEELLWSHDVEMADGDNMIEGCAVLAKALKDQVNQSKII